MSSFAVLRFSSYVCILHLGYANQHTATVYMPMHYMYSVHRLRSTNPCLAKKLKLENFKCL